MRLGTSVVVLPLHNPLEVAEQMAMVDLLSNGRLELGVGRGFVEHDYQVLGVDYADAQDRLVYRDDSQVFRMAVAGGTPQLLGTLASAAVLANEPGLTEGDSTAPPATS